MTTQNVALQPNDVDKQKGAATPQYILDNVKKYFHETVRRTSFLVYEEDEPEIFNALNGRSNRSGYLRGLIANYVSEPSDLTKYTAIRTNHEEKRESIRVDFLVNKNKFPELIEVLDEQHSISEFMKALIRKDLGVTVS